MSTTQTKDAENILTMPVRPDDKSLETTYPSVDLAYPLAIETYEWAQKRKEQVDNRVQTLLAFIVSIVLVVTPLIRANVSQASFQSIWFVLAMLAFGIAVVLGITARFMGTLRLIDPRCLYNEWLHLSKYIGNEIL